MTAAQVMLRCRELAAITDVPGETTRTFLSPAMRRANERAGEWMRSAGLQVCMDAAGNLRGVLPSSIPGARTLVLGSHLDTVPNAGAFDGVLGVMMALAVVTRLGNDALPFHVEVIAFSEEEGIRFGVPFIGSRAVAGTIDGDLLSRTDANGISVRDAIRAYGLDDSTIPAAKIENALGYLEFHIEQGPVLESEGLPLGVVTALVGQSRYQLTFTGQANHAGTTPMRLRHDAMAAAAEWITQVEQTAVAASGLVATVGSVQTLPGAGNVIAGQVRATLDVRSPNDGTRTQAARTLLAAAESCAQKRGVQVQAAERVQQPAVQLDAALGRVLEEAVEDAGALVYQMTSGAGHDAMIVAPYMPAAMLFLRSPGGLSHHPDEAVLEPDVELGVDAGVRFVRALAATEQARKEHAR